MELSARAVLASGIDDLDEYGNQKTDVSRCACDYFDFLTDRTTQAFISALPLPDIVKDYLHEVAEMMCEKHPADDDLHNLCARCEDDEVFEDSGLTQSS